MALNCGIVRKLLISLVNAKKNLIYIGFRYPLQH